MERLSENSMKRKCAAALRLCLVRVVERACPWRFAILRFSGFVADKAAPSAVKIDDSRSASIFMNQARSRELMNAFKLLALIAKICGSASFPRAVSIIDDLCFACAFSLISASDSHPRSLQIGCHRRVRFPPANPTIPSMGPPTLKPGDVAPPVTIAQWIQGEAAGAASEPAVRVVEFFATWCKPCRETMPHLDTLRQKYGSKLDVVAVAVWERGDVDEIAGNVRELIASLGADRVTYPIAVDNPVPGQQPMKGKPRSGRTAAAYLDAAGINGIPSAFVVSRDGRIAWIGHPLACESVVEACINGTFEIERAAADYVEALERREKMATIKRAFDAAVWEKDYTTAEIKARELAEVDPRNGVPIVVQLYRNQLKAEPAKIVDYLDSVLRGDDDTFPPSLKLRCSFWKLEILLQAKDIKSALSHAQTLLADLKSAPESDKLNTASTMASLSHAVVGDFLALQAEDVIPEKDRRDLAKLAVQAGRGAIELSGRKFDYLTTCAEALWIEGSREDKEEAVAMLRDAIAGEDSPGGMAVRRLQAKIEAWESELMN